jgi:hypothetical protein
MKKIDEKEKERKGKKYICMRNRKNVSISKNK